MSIDDHGEPTRLAQRDRSAGTAVSLRFFRLNIRDVGYIQELSDRCPDGKANESNDVAFNRQHFIIDSSSIGSASVSVDFAGTCPVRLRPADACALVPAEWASTFLDDRSRTHVIGTRSSHRGLRSDSTTLGFVRQRFRRARCHAVQPARFHPVTPFDLVRPTSRPTGGRARRPPRRARCRLPPRA